MASRSTLILGALGLAGIVAATAWSVRRESSGPTSVPAPDHRPVEGDGKSGPATPLSPLPSAAAPSTEREAPATVSPVAAAQAPEAPPETPPVIEEVVEPPKLSTLDPIVGGENAIRGKYASSTYAERAQRLATLESALAVGQPEDPSHADAYTALKDELGWLRENLGTPPK